MSHPEQCGDPYDCCENCSARQAETTCGVGGVETRLCGYCAASLEGVSSPLFPEDDGSWVFPNAGNGWSV